MVTFSRIDSSGSSPSTLRSSVSSATPEFIMLRGPFGLTVSPSILISPSTMGSDPKMDSSSSLRPEPSSPPMPRISPARTSKSTAGLSSVRRRPRTLSRAGPSSLASSGYSADTSRPTMAVISLFSS